MTFALILMNILLVSVQSPLPVATPSPTAAETKTSEPQERLTASPNKNPGRPKVELSPEKAQPIAIPMTEKSPVIDGNLDDEVWKQAAVLKNFYQIEPGDNIAPSKPTECLITYDEKFLYLAFRAIDDAGQVRANIAKRDAIFEDDNVRIVLDTFYDRRKAYILAFNPLGVQADGILTDGVSEDYSVDILMESKGALNNQGYTVEVAIPFKSLRYEAGKDKVWGVHVFRRIKRFNNELNSWMPIARERYGLLNQVGRITGLSGISAERTLELIPSLTLSETGQRRRTLTPAQLEASPFLLDPGRFVNRPIEADPGLTAKVGITPTITLDLAVNPDFAQVEADKTVVLVNQRFPIFFEEKRPFFLEGIDIFQTALSPVHTRTIIDPDVAAKITGRRGRNTFGVLVASDNAPGNFNEDERLEPQNFRFIDKNAYIAILRGRRDVGQQSSLGFIATHYSFIERHNTVGGVDGRFRINPSTVFNFQVLGTTSRRFFFDADVGSRVYRTGNALGYSFTYDKVGRNFSYTFNGEGRSTNYRADVGFTRRINTNSENLFLRYVSEPNPQAKLVSWRVTNYSNVNFDWQGRSQNWDNEVQLGWNFQRQTSLVVGFNRGYERVFEEEFGPKRTATRAGTFAGDDSERSIHRKELFMIAETIPRKEFSASLFLSRTWGAFDFDFGAEPRFQRVSPGALLNPNAPLDPGPGDALFIEGRLIFQPTEKLNASLNYTKSKLRRYDTGLLAFNENIYSVRSIYQFTRFVFTRARVDYSTLTGQVQSELLLGWTPNPGTSLYIGYNDDLNFNGFNPFTGQLEPGFQRNGRTFFIKMSYLIRRSF